MKNNHLNPAQLLRAHRLSVTAPRLAILELFNKSKRPLAAQEVADSLPRSGSSAIDQATVYRTIGAFKARGLIKPIDLRHNHAHYELTNLAEHHHLICLHCGRVEDVEQCGVEEIQTKVLRGSRHFAEIRQHALEFYGLCKACANK